MRGRLFFSDLQFCALQTLYTYYVLYLLQRYISIWVTGLQGERAEQQADQLHDCGSRPRGDLQDRAEDQDRGQGHPTARSGDGPHEAGAGHLPHRRRSANR